MILVDKGLVKFKGDRELIVAEFKTIAGMMYENKYFCHLDKELFQDMIDNVVATEDEMAKKKLNKKKKITNLIDKLRKD